METNPALMICGVACGVPAIVSLVVVMLVRSFARRRLTMNIERSSIPLPDLRPDTKRVAIYFDLEERQQRLPKEEEEEEK